MINKKGFTLIELLAVILILGIIALIAIPTITTIIEDSKKGALKLTANTLADAAEKLCQMEQMRGTDITKNYTITNGVVSSPLDVKNLPENGTIIVDNECNASVAIVNNNYCSIKRGDTTSINSNINKCVIDETEIPVTKDSCFTFDETTHTITGYNFDNPTCSSEVSIPAMINGIPVEHIKDYAFVNGEYELQIYFGFKDIPVELKRYADMTAFDGMYDIKDNVLKLGYNDIVMIELFNIVDASTKKYCYNYSDYDESELPYDYVIADSDNYDNCYFNGGEDELFTRAISTGIDKVDFSHATNLIDIGKGAFYNNQVTFVRFGNLPKLKSLGVSSFYMNNITGIVDLSGLTGLTEIASSIFYKNNISKVLLPPNLTSIGAYAFYENDLTELSLQNSIKTIKSFAFYNNHIKDITIPDGIINIENSVFYGNDLTNVNINNNVKYILNSSFGDNQLEKVDLPDSILAIENLAFANNPIKSLEIPNKIEYLSGFNGTSIGSISIPNTVEAIGGYAFYGTPITSLEIPSSVTDIYASAFYGTSLKTLTLGNDLKNIYNYAFASIKDTISSVVIPSGITTIAQNTFRATKIESLTIGDNVEAINDSAFSGSYIKNMTWGSTNKLKTIGNYAFQNYSADSLDIPSGVTAIGYSAFVYGAETTINIPDTVKTINYSAFSGSRNLKVANIGTGITSIGSNGFGCFNDVCKGITINIARQEGTVKGSPWGAREPIINWTGTK